MNTITSFHGMEEHLARFQQRCRLLVAPNPGPRVKTLLELARRNHVRVETVDPKELDRLAGPGHKGAVLLLPQEKQHQFDYEDLLAQALEAPRSPGFPLLLGLDSLTDQGNLGAIIRSADLFEVDGIVLPQRRSAQVGETVARTSAGADAWVQTPSVSNLVRALKLAQESGYWVVGADMAGEPLHLFDCRRPLLLVMGSEGKGLGNLVRSSCDSLVSIPQGGHIDSLNVSVAAGIMMYEIRRQQAFAGIGRSGLSAESSGQL